MAREEDAPSLEVCAFTPTRARSPPQVFTQPRERGGWVGERDAKEVGKGKEAIASGARRPREGG